MSRYLWKWPVARGAPTNHIAADVLARAMGPSVESVHLWRPGKPDGHGWSVFRVVRGSGGVKVRCEEDGPVSRRESASVDHATSSFLQYVGERCECGIPDTHGPASVTKGNGAHHPNDTLAELLDDPIEAKEECT